MPSLCRLWSFFATAVYSLALPLDFLDARQQSYSDVVNQTTCDTNTYTYNSLAGFGFVPANAQDKVGDTLGGYGSAIALDQSSWKKRSDGSYTGTLWALPNRGWHKTGNLKYRSRVHKFALTLTPQPSASLSNPSPPNLDIAYLDSILFTGSGGSRVSLDTEGLVLSPTDNSFWVSDEKGPFIYHFSADGSIISVIHPPEAFLARKKGSRSIFAHPSPIYDQDGIIAPRGIADNQGFEGLSLSPDGTTLSVLPQSALEQDGGNNDAARRYVRMLQYDISNASSPVYISQFVVPLPVFTNSKGNTKIAAQSELHALSSTRFFILARDSGKGYGNGKSNTESLYRHIDVFDTSNATNIKGMYDNGGDSIASADQGVLVSGIVPADYCSFLDFNVNSQLGRFGLHNGGEEDKGLLNAKWESMAVAPVHPSQDPNCEAASFSSGEVFVFSFSDNDFVTQEGHMDNGGYNYTDDSGYDIDNQALVFKVTLPEAD